MNKLPISVCVISGAETLRIGRMLGSIAAWTSEIIVVLNDDAQDGTDAIAASFGAKIRRHPWQGFREQKNLALGFATQPWILALDADEEVSPGLRQSIAQFFTGDHEHFAGAEFPRKVWFMGRWITHGDWYPDRVLRLFRRDAGQWAGSPEHCHVELRGSGTRAHPDTTPMQDSAPLAPRSGERARERGSFDQRGAVSRGTRCTRLPADLLHYSNPDISSYVQKINYFADLYLQRQLAEKARWSAPAAIFRAAWRFARAYLFRFGFLDGYPGFFIAASTAYSTLVRHSRLFEHLQPRQPPCAPPKSP